MLATLLHLLKKVLQKYKSRHVVPIISLKLYFLHSIQFHAFTLLLDSLLFFRNFFLYPMMCRPVSSTIQHFYLLVYILLGVLLATFFQLFLVLKKVLEKYIFLCLFSSVTITQKVLAKTKK